MAMLQLNLNLPELQQFVKTIAESRANFFDIMRMDTKKVAEEFLEKVMSCELDLFLGRDKYDRQTDVSVKKRNYRNGSYSRSFSLKGIGHIKVTVPRDRKGDFKSSLLEKYARSEDSLKEDAALLYLLGTSTRSISMISKHLFGTAMSRQQISNSSSKLADAVEKWRTRPIEEKIKYIYVDGTNFTMRIGSSIEKVNVLVAIGVGLDGKKLVLGLQAGDKESSTSWREFFKDLKKRGLDKQEVLLGIMDGLVGLEKVFKEEFPLSKIQRCQVHAQRNILAKVPHKYKKEVADEVRSIYYAPCKKKALKKFDQVKDKWNKIIPSAIKCLESTLGQTLCYYAFPQEEWVSLRTTNPIERLNKEFKRRTKSMEIVAGEKSCYNLLAIICLKMEAYWKGHKVNSFKTLPWLETAREFTQKI